MLRSTEEEYFKQSAVGAILPRFGKYCDQPLKSRGRPSELFKIEAVNSDVAGF